MPKSPNQKMKPLLLQRILLERTDEDHGLTVPELIALLEEEGVAAERKSVYSDLQTLADFGLDIVKRKESGKVVYYVGARTFELPELKLLVDAVQSSRFITHKKSNQLIQKVEGFASRYQAQQLQRQVLKQIRQFRLMARLTPIKKMLQNGLMPRDKTLLILMPKLLRAAL